MNRDWLSATYREIKQGREEKLARILALLRPKAETDSEIREAVGLLESWVGGDTNQEPGSVHHVTASSSNKRRSSSP